uniref:Uncharacterized protein n=1 Tax=Arundo donax TaxID=35708 RepID=A0A0A9GWT0_ARUDO
MKLRRRSEPAAAPGNDFHGDELNSKPF